MARFPSLLILLVALVLAGCGGGGDGGNGAGDGRDGGSQGGPDQTERESGGQTPKQTDEVAGGTTAIRLSDALARVLETAGATIEPTGEASGDGGELKFPITGGTLDPTGPSGVVEHSGGLRIEGRGRSLDVSELRLDAGAGELTGEVGGRRVPIFAVETTSPRQPVEGGVAVLEGRLRTPERSVLEERLRLRLPAGGLPVGRVIVSAQRPDAGG